MTRSPSSSAFSASSGRAAEAILAVVVVLEHVRAGACRPREQCDATRIRHHRAEGILVRRRHVGEPGAPAGAREHVEVEALVVGRHEGEAGAGGEKGAARALVSRLFDRRDVARREQQAGRQVEALLRPAHDQELLGVAPDAATAQEIARERRAQRRRALRVTVVVVGRRGAPRAAAEAPLPDLDREVLHARRAVAEVVRQAGAGAHVRAEDRPRAPIREPRAERGEPRRRRRGWREAGRHAARRGGRGDRLHEGAGAAPAVEVAFGREVFVGEEHGRPREAELTRERARRGEAGTRRDRAFVDPRTKRAIELAEEGAVAVEPDPHGVRLEVASRTSQKVD